MTVKSGKFALAISALIISWVSPASAETTSEMRSYCRPISSATQLDNGTVQFDPTFNAGRCWGAFRLIQEAQRYRDYSDGPFTAICAPETSKLTQFIEIFVKYADDNPQDLHESWLPVAVNALARAFPCPKIVR
ncbi:Rap1a/Tai family immunity protein [Brucella anthropi]|uniref:Rap1a/Tai family immunity protein n=1 Tax=Brucella anthropi TaxID=529 RepID=UPI003510D167